MKTFKILMEEVLNEKGKKPAFGNSEGKSYAVQINSLDSNEFFKQPFGRRLSDLRKAVAFSKEAKSAHVGAKGESTMKAVKKWVKDMKPSEFYASWQSDSSYYKDDSVQIFYKA